MKLADGREVLATLALPLPLADAGELMAAIGRCAEEIGYTDVVYDTVSGGIVGRRDHSGEVVVTAQTTGDVL